MKKIKIIHAADLHLDSPFEALGNLAATRRGEQRELLCRIAELVGSEGADLLLLSGDLLDGGFAYAETAKMLCSVLGDLSCPVFISPGNHDFYSAKSPYARLELPENVHIFKSPKISCVELLELSVRIWGAGFNDIECPPLLQNFSFDKIPGVFDLAVLHGDTGSAHSPYNPISAQDIAASGFDYLALGHVHSFSGLQKSGSTFFAYPGAPEGRGFDECGEKGVLSVEISESGVFAKFIETASRKYRVLRADANAPIEAQIAPSPRDIVRVELFGACESAPNLAAIRERLKDYFFALELKDKTTLAENIWARAEEDTLRGLFLRKMRQELDATEGDFERAQICAAVRWGIAALDGGEEAEIL